MNVLVETLSFNNSALSCSEKINHGLLCLDTNGCKETQRDEFLIYRWLLHILVGIMFTSFLVYEKKCAFAGEEQKQSSEREYHE